MELIKIVNENGTIIEGLDPSTVERMADHGAIAKGWSKLVALTPEDDNDPTRKLDAKQPAAPKCKTKGCRHPGVRSLRGHCSPCYKALPDAEKRQPRKPKEPVPTVEPPKGEAAA